MCVRGKIDSIVMRLTVVRRRRTRLRLANDQKEPVEPGVVTVRRGRGLPLTDDGFEGGRDHKLANPFAKFNRT